MDAGFIKTRRRFLYGKNKIKIDKKKRQGACAKRNLFHGQIRRKQARSREYSAEQENKKPNRGSSRKNEAGRGDKGAEPPEIPEINKR